MSKVIFYLFFALSFAVSNFAFAQLSANEDELDFSDVSVENPAEELALPPETSQTSEPLEIIDPQEPNTNYIAAPNSDRGDVVVEMAQDINKPYRERRGTFGVLFSVNYEKYLPESYYSVIQEKEYNDLTGSQAISVVGAEFGLKYNFNLGSVAAVVGYAGGSISDSQNQVDYVGVKISKAALNLSLDTLTSEPWVVPYGQVGVHQFDWTEESYNSTNVLETEQFVSSWALSYKVGVLFQLNWLEKMIDPNTHYEGLRSSGLENTYLDVFYSVYTAPSSIAADVNEEGEADLSSAQLGVGLKLEF